MKVTPIEIIASLKRCGEHTSRRDCTKCAMYTENPEDDLNCDEKLKLAAAEVIDTLLTLAASAMVEAHMQEDYIEYLEGMMRNAEKMD